jgi:hypothetical protein
MAKTPNGSPANDKAAVAVELYEALQKLGAKSDLLGLVGSYGDTLEDEEILDGLRKWNDLYAHAERDEAANGEAALKLELYRVFENLGAPREQLRELAPWSNDEIDDAGLLKRLRKFNQSAD